ncbi:TatD family hydrolase [Paraglaciecola aquimarina]|uniref:TatD family hydrolase n=1 Tax=Paraglaciecola algarum TaxID=3050085 RepID=A0ABS9D8G5_9ALTE|nr:TatD family hydrolase [Paraglaciecola sp. G1-23]MCF2949220.1 TatD family hydrolase [Paraglaciecola sp. G1-23]
MNWCDIGVNFTDKRLELEPVLARSFKSNVNQIIITGTSIPSSLKAVELASAYPKHLYSTAGVHPHHASEFSQETVKQLKQLANNSLVVAIGECGLDFNRNFSTPEQQVYAFEQQLQLACELQLPVFLHERDAFDTQIEILSKYQNNLVGGVAHCFTGNQHQMLQYLELGFYIGITGWVCDLKRGTDLRDAITSLPLERLLLETDAPYLRPKGLANNRKLDKGNNEPAYLPFIAQQVADLMQVDLTVLNQASLNNTQQLFGLAGIDN